jgi:hexosaminidase
VKTIIIGSLLTLFATSGFAAAPAIIPAPQKMEPGKGSFFLTAKTRIVTDAASRQTGEVLAARLAEATGNTFSVNAGDRTAATITNAVLLTTAGAKADLGAEGYELSASPDAVVIRAPEQAGLFYGVQTLLQLLPPEIFASNVVRGKEWEIPAVRIEDRPRFQWRGLMLDVSRHFFTVREVERLLDEMALHKLNTFHWHLTDDQGWRIEIKKYPKLVQIGAWRPGTGFGLTRQESTAYDSNGRYGGFYTQDDIREVVKYAAARHITIVPEIEMPGHASAALAAYPEFSCTGGPFEPGMAGGVFHGIYCAGNDATFKFLDDVLTEVAAVFPGKYIHIGGDEVPKDTWKHCPKCQERIRAEGLKNEEELQSYFIRRVEKLVNAHGHALIGWSEILQGGLAEKAAVMDWIGGGAQAARSGHDAVMTPTRYCYLDSYQSTNHANEPRGNGGSTPLQKVYSFEAIPGDLAPEFQPHILGAQANVWTEYIPNFSHAEYMIFPRACALAEVMWSPKEARDWEDFTRRLATHEQRLAQLGVNFRRNNGMNAAQKALVESPAPPSPAPR